MKISCIILLIFCLNLPQKALCQEDVKTIFVSAAVNNKAIDVKRRLEELLPQNTAVIYTIVPRGLIVSIREDTFFRGESIHINRSGVNVLNGIAQTLREIDNNCTIESHTEGHNNKDGDFHTNWEISMARANSITDYLIYCGNIPPARVFPLGLGDFMPFKDNVSAESAGFDKRIDFVIFDYEYER